MIETSFLENLGSRAYSTSTSFLQIPPKRNAPTIPNLARPTSPSKHISNFTKSLFSSNSEEHYIDFKKSLLPLIQSSESDDLKSTLMPTEAQWYQLNQLRIHAGAPERSEDGVERLYQYYAQLVAMEKKFPYDTNKIDVVFSWDDALFSEKVVCNCIQYEKAAVLFNAASVYSHLGATQFFKTSEGKKKAAIYFRKSANLLIFCRDSLCQRLKVKISGNSDLDESTLSALSNIMMAQAVECFYEKANEVNTSSQVTSQIAIEVADHYENALQFTSSNTFPLSRDKLPKNWIMTARTKAHLFTAIAHFHAPSTMSTEVLVAERIARLYLAKTFIDKSLKCSYGGSLQSITMGYSDLITTNLNMTQTENFQRYHQPEMDARLLSPLRHASQDLFTGIDTHPLGDLDRFPDFFHSLISPTRHIDIKNFYNESIKTVESNLMMLKGLINSIEKSASIGASVPNLSNIVAFDSNKLDSKDKSALELIEKIRSCRITEETTPSQELINSLTRQHTTMKTMLTDSIQILKTTTKQGQQVQEMMEKTQSFVESITSIKHTIRDLLSIHDRIKQTGLTDWTDSELRELLPCIDAEYNDIAFIENMKTMPEIIQREKESLIVKLDDLKHRVTLAINEFSKLGSNSALFWRDCESSSIEKHKEQLRIAEDAGILLKRETSNLVLKIDEIKSNCDKFIAFKQRDSDHYRIITSFSNSVEDYLEFRTLITLEVKKNAPIQGVIESFYESVQILDGRHVPRKTRTTTQDIQLANKMNALMRDKRIEKPKFDKQDSFQQPVYRAPVRPGPQTTSDKIKDIVRSLSGGRGVDFWKKEESLYVSCEDVLPPGVDLETACVQTRHSKKKVDSDLSSENLIKEPPFKNVMRQRDEDILDWISRPKEAPKEKNLLLRKQPNYTDLNLGKFDNLGGLTGNVLNNGLKKKREKIKDVMGKVKKSNDRIVDEFTSSSGSICDSRFK